MSRTSATTPEWSVSCSRKAPRSRQARACGLDAMSQAIGHAHLSTSLDIYGHGDESELEAAMERYMEWLEENGL